MEADISTLVGILGGYAWDEELIGHKSNDRVKRRLIRQNKALTTDS
jgi:hypothetical protein